jgi:hypothetical protein
MRPAAPFGVRMVITYYDTRIAPGGSDTTTLASKHQAQFGEQAEDRSVRVAFPNFDAAPARSDSGRCAVRYLSGIEAEPSERLQQFVLLVRKV